MNDPYGRITAECKVNEQYVAIGESSVLSGETISTRFDDWFGWSMIAALMVGIAISIFKT